MKTTRITVYFCPYKTPKDIIFTFFHEQILKNKKSALNTKVTFQDFSARTKKMTVAHAIKVINKLGVWGFCVTKNSKEKVIHYWYKDRKNIKLLSNLFAHEYSHAIFGHSEKLACQCGLAAHYAIKYMQKEKLIKV